MNQPNTSPCDVRGDIDPLGGIDVELLGALLDAVVPGDEHPSASASGGLTFLRRVFVGEQPIQRLERFLYRVAQTAVSLGVDPRTAVSRVLEEL